MKHFTSVHDLDSLDEALKLALELKKDPYKYQSLGKNKTLLLVFFNSSLRTRLSTQKAGLNLGMNVIVFDINEGGAGRLDHIAGVEGRLGHPVRARVRNNFV